MQTAVEWYSDKLLEILGDKVNDFTKEQTLANHYALKQAKEMENQQVESKLNEYVNKLLCTKEIKIEMPMCSNTIAISINEFLNTK